MLGLCIIPRGLPCVGGLWGLCSPHFAPKSVRGVGESRTPACCTHGPREVLPAKRKSDQRTHRAPPLEYRSHPPRIPSSCRAPQSSCCTKVCGRPSFCSLSAAAGHSSLATQGEPTSLPPRLVDRTLSPPATWLALTPQYPQQHAPLTLAPRAPPLSSHALSPRCCGRRL